MEPSSYKLAGESLAAATGIFPDGPISPKHVVKAEALADRAQKIVTKFCKFGEFEAFVMQKRVENLEEQFLNLAPLSEADVRFYCAGLVDPDVITAWAEAVNRGRAYLRSKWPAFIRETPTGPVWIDPPRSVVNHISLAAAVTNDPVAALEEMSREVLTPDVVECLKEVYPEVYNRILAVLSSSLQEAGELGKKCPWRHEKQLRVMFEQPPTGLVTFGVEEEGEKPESPKLDIKFDGLQTRGQSL